MSRSLMIAFLSTALVASFAAADEQAGLTINTQVDSKKEAKKTSLTVKPGLVARTTEDEFVNSKWGGGFVDIAGERKVGSMLSAKLDMSVYMTTGSYTSQYPDVGSSKGPNAVLLNEAFLTVKPIKQFSLDAGIVATSFSALPSMFEANGFPSVRATAELEGDTMKASVFGMQSIPTSDTATVQPTESGVTTTLTTYGVNIGPSSKYDGAFSLEAGLTRFSFKDLNSSAATDSQYLGNTVVSPGAQARFAYGFGGYEYGLGAKLNFTKFTKAFVSGAFLKNEEAPDLSNRGYAYQAGLTFPIAANEMTVSGGYFFNESDTVPGAYASAARAFNNRFGPMAALRFKNEKEGVAGNVRYVRANEIEDLAYTADREIITFTLEIAYEVL